VSRKAAITINRPREAVERHWRSQPESAELAATFVDAPGDRGTEIHVELEGSPRGGKLGEVVKKVVGTEERAKAMDHLRRFKQQVETGVIVRSDAAPEGELAERKLKQRPAQPPTENEAEEAKA
jgi:uncharacterized membrane protein